MSDEEQIESGEDMGVSDYACALVLRALAEGPAQPAEIVDRILRGTGGAGGRTGVDHISIYRMLDKLVDYKFAATSFVMATESSVSALYFCLTPKGAAALRKYATPKTVPAMQAVPLVIMLFVGRTLLKGLVLWLYAAWFLAGWRVSFLSATAAGLVGGYMLSGLHAEVGELRPVSDQNRGPTAGELWERAWRPVVTAAVFLGLGLLLHLAMTHT